MSAAPAVDTSDTLQIRNARQRHELLMRLRSQYDLSAFAVDALDRTGVMKLVDTVDFLANNLPPNSLAAK